MTAFYTDKELKKLDAARKQKGDSSPRVIPAEEHGVTERTMK